MATKFKKALSIFLAILRGEEYIKLGPYAWAVYMDCSHPDAPGGLTPLELMYGVTDFGTPVPESYRQK